MTNKFDTLFQPMKIGPVTAPNRFYQVPHCNGMGYQKPKALAKMRSIKAEGGWGVVCTEEVEIHHSSDISTSIEGRLWGEKDMPSLALMANSVHQHGALAGIQLVYSGHNAPNLYSRSTGFGPRSLAVNGFHPKQTRRMDKEDIRNLRQWHRAAAIRAKKAGFELVEASEINANPLDSANHPKGVWTLPPRLALGEEKAEQYKAIGESDRMTLKFKKL